MQSIIGPCDERAIKVGKIAVVFDWVLSLGAVGYLYSEGIIYQGYRFQYMVDLNNCDVRRRHFKDLTRFKRNGFSALIKQNE